MIGVCQTCGKVKDIVNRNTLQCRPCYMRSYHAKDQPHDKPGRPKLADDFTKGSLVKIIAQVQRSHAWMLKDIKHRADDCETTDYSDELKHALEVQKLLDMI